MRVKFLPFMCGTCLLSLSSCLTLVKDHGKSRESHPMSVGTGFVYTPKKSAGFGVVFDTSSLASPEQVMIRSGSRGANSYSINSDATDQELRKVRSVGVSADLLTIYFPWDNSAFFAGVSGRARHSRNAYNEWKNDFKTSGDTVNVEWEDQSLSLGAILGLNLRYENLTSCTIGAAMGRRFLNQRHFLDNGNSDRVDSEKRTSTLASYDDYRERWAPMYVAMWSYSFKP